MADHPSDHAVPGGEKERPPIEPILDGASPHPAGLPAELEGEREIARDESRELEERLEAYENIIDSEVGDTSLVRARNIEREHSLRQLYLKFDGGNPTGTQKDRIAFAQAMDALRRGYEAMTAASCGNYGAALALAASYANLGCIIYIPSGYRSRRIDEMRSLGATIMTIEGDYEAAVDASRERAGREEVYDANPGGANTAIQMRAYGEIAHEIYDDLRDAPAAVAVPVSNGTTLAGIYRGFASLYRRGKTSRMPRMVAGSSFRKNPIVQSFVRGTPDCENLDPAAIRETAVNEPLINWHSIDGDLALNAIRETGGWAGYASDRSMVSQARAIRESEGLSVLPASTAGLIALLEGHRRAPLTSDRFVVVITGRKT